MSATPSQSSSKSLQVSGIGAPGTQSFTPQLDAIRRHHPVPHDARVQYPVGGAQSVTIMGEPAGAPPPTIR